MGAGAKGAPGSAAVCWTLGILCGLLLALDVPAKLAWLDETADAFDAAIMGDVSPATPQPQRGRASSPQASSAHRQSDARSVIPGITTIARMMPHVS